MKREITDIIVLHTTKFGDNSLIVHAVSPLYGRCGMIVKGFGKKGGRNPVSLFQPLNILEAVVDENPKSSLLSLREASMKHPYVSIRRDVLKNCISVFVCELLFRTLSEGSREDGLFEWVEEMALALDAMDGNFSNFHIYFIIGLCRILGFSPNDNFSENNPIFYIATAEFSGGGQSFSLENSLLLHRLLSGGFPECMALPLTGKSRYLFMEDMIRFLEYHIDKPVEIKSLEVLHELLC